METSDRLVLSGKRPTYSDVMTWSESVILVQENMDLERFVWWPLTSHSETL